tara:strand:- start:70 stop:231 length:162 start_codon:yes stop_codon:yes gene_type:complete
MGKNRVQRKDKEKAKPKKDKIYNQRHVRITLMKQEKKLSRSGILSGQNQILRK